MGMLKKKVEEVPSVPVVAVEQTIETVNDAVQNVHTRPTRSGFNQPLTDYDLRKDRQIGVAGVVQAVVGSDWYGRQAALTDLESAEAVTKLRVFAEQEIDYWLAAIQKRSV